MKRFWFAVCIMAADLLLADLCMMRAIETGDSGYLGFAAMALVGGAGVYAGLREIAVP